MYARYMRVEKIIKQTKYGREIRAERYMYIYIINNARSRAHNARERNAPERDSHERTGKKVFRCRPFADADLIVPGLGWRFLPRGFVARV